MADEKVIHEKIEDTQRHMEETRASLATKLDKLESQVAATVEGATEAVATVTETVQESVERAKEVVQETVQTVQDTVQNTVTSVSEAFDLGIQTRRHPWAMLGGSVLVGFMGGRLLLPSKIESDAAPPTPERHVASHSHGHTKSNGRGKRHAEHEKGWLQGLVEKFEPELDKVKNMALATLVAGLYDWISPSIPEAFRSQVHDIADEVSQKLSGTSVSFAEATPSQQQGGFSPEGKRFAG